MNEKIQKALATVQSSANEEEVVEALELLRQSGFGVTDIALYYYYELETANWSRNYVEEYSTEYEVQGKHIKSCEFYHEQRPRLISPGSVWIKERKIYLVFFPNEKAVIVKQYSTGEIDILKWDGKSLEWDYMEWGRFLKKWKGIFRGNVVWEIWENLGTALALIKQGVKKAKLGPFPYEIELPSKDEVDWEFVESNKEEINRDVRRLASYYQSVIDSDWLSRMLIDL
jgi:hypothetical protein